MRPIFALVALVLAIPLMGQAPAPRLELSEPGWDFGELLQGEKRGEADKKIIRVFNRGTAPLRLQKIDVTCGCITLDKTPQTIQPGEVFALQLDLDSRRGEGEIKKFVVLKTNDPVRTKVELPMTGTIHPVWQISTKNLNLGSVKNGAPFETSFTIDVRKGHELKIEEMLSHSQFLILTPERFENEDGSHGYKVKVTMSEKIQTGYFEDIILVRTDYAPVPQRGLRVLGEIASSTKVSPAKLNFGVLIPGQKKTLKLRLEKESGTGLEVMQVRCEDSQISTKVVTITKGKIYEVEVTVDPSEDKRVLRGRLAISVEEPGGVVLTVDYSGRILLP